MNSSNRYWLLLEKSDETRISKGIDSYQDLTGESYHYDSFVPNHKNVKSDDFVVLRKENEILGVGKIGIIAEADDTKIHRRCPECNSTDIRKRTTRTPKWKCGKCSQEFTDPRETITKVRSFTASIDQFTRLNSPPTVNEVKLCARGGDGVSSQLSILELEEYKIGTLLEGIDISPSPRSSQQEAGGQGFGLSQGERMAVELLAMHLARGLYEDDGWMVIDKSSSYPFDLFATRGLERRFIEVKGTTGEGRSIILTHGEVKHARSHEKESALVIVTNIKLEIVNDHWVAKDGKISTHEYPWDILDSGLHATQFRYEIQE